MHFIVIADNIRSTHNVGALFRTADCFGAESLWLCGISPFPATKDDTRLPHIANKLHDQIRKTALGAEQSVQWHYFETTTQAIRQARKLGYKVIALEQDKKSKLLQNYVFLPNISYALVVGTEVTGLDKDALDSCDECLEISQYGNKESLNVSVAAGICMYKIATDQRSTNQ